MMDAPTPPTAPQPFTGRRSFLQWLAYLLGGVAAAIVAIPCVGYLVGVGKREDVWVPLGDVSDFKEDETRLITFANPIASTWDGATARTGVFVRYLGKVGGKDDFLILAVNCAHLGCPVSWFPQSGLFMCPCHGGVYYADGERASGPPPQGLFHCVWRIHDGELQVSAPHYPTLHDPLEAKG